MLYCLPSTLWTISESPKNPLTAVRKVDTKRTKAEKRVLCVNGMKKKITPAPDSSHQGSKRETINISHLDGKKNEMLQCIKDAFNVLGQIRDMASEGYYQSCCNELDDEYAKFYDRT